ncbi:MULTISPECIES: hypothetical protein [Mesorhizobium]|uniref:hypothetical protein n=1 Tax=Mesorhizobium TaxID=68287 RepID=UPI0011409DC3|nr:MULTISPECIES: hypothetical protein [Mesorhizobium]QIA22516.1 hypothetical protein A9K68_012580 [Mesorhizobium sp. AA22]
MPKLDPDLLARRSRILDEICDSKHRGKKRGSLPFALMDRRHVLEIRDELRSTPGAQNDFVKVISAMYGWAVENEVAKVIRRCGSGG